MKIAVHVIGCVQVSEDSFQRRVTTWSFDSSQTIDEILKTTKMSDISLVNFSNIIEGAKNTEQKVQPDGADKPLAGQLNVIQAARTGKE